MWELLHCSNSYWDKDTAKEATIWLIEDKSKWSDNDVRNKFSAQVFKDNGRGGMLTRVFVNSPYEALNNAYPNKFKRHELYSYRKNGTIVSGKKNRYKKR